MQEQGSADPSRAGSGDAVIAGQSQGRPGRPCATCRTTRRGGRRTTTASATQRRRLLLLCWPRQRPPPPGAGHGGCSDDEFVAVLADVPPELAGRSSQRTADAVLGSLSTPPQIAGELGHLGASVGVALYRDHGNNAQQLLHAADHAGSGVVEELHAGMPMVVPAGRGVVALRSSADGTGPGPPLVVLTSPTRPPRSTGADGGARLLGGVEDLVRRCRTRGLTSP